MAVMAAAARLTNQLVQLPGMPLTAPPPPLCPLQFINGHPSKGSTGIWTNAFVNAKTIGPEHVALMHDASSNFR
jgi:hypothetical protein